MKSEKEKMLSEELYISDDKELVNDRLNVRNLLYEFNNSRPTELEKRNLLVSKIINVTSTINVIEPPFNCDYGYNITVGKDFYANYGLVILDCAKVTIGDNVLIGPNVQIYTAGHPTSIEKRLNCLEYAKHITIENNVWIGGNVTICPGVTIGEGSVIGAGSVVTKDIPPRIVVAGNPCRYLKDI